MEELHKPVLLSEVLAILQPKQGESYMDLTAGYAGHASKILDVTQNYKDSVLIDRDENAIRYLREKYGESIKLVNNDFYSAALQEIECGNTFDIILADFGVSSPQLDQAERGFSFSHDGPLDMRMNQQQSFSASTVVNKWSERELADLFVEYGEEKPGFAKLVARTIVHGRPWDSTSSRFREARPCLTLWWRAGLWFSRFCLWDFYPPRTMSGTAGCGNSAAIR